MDLSVLLITFNNEKHIEDTLNSILKQNCTFGYEIVVGDDCSSDNTLEIINSYNSKHPGIFNIKKNNSQLGILKNFKATLDRCQGTYIFDIAGDDILKSDTAFEKMITVLKSNSDLGFVDSGYDKLYDDSNKTEFFVNKKSIVAEKQIYKELLFLGKIIPVGICYSRKLLYKHVDFGYFIEQNITIEDYPILVNLATNSDFERINESLHVYRIHKTSDSYRTHFEKVFFFRNQMLKLFNHFKSKYNFSPSIIKTYEQTYYKTVLFYAGTYQKKDLGKEMFKKIESKNIYDIIHYLASQYKIVRKLAKMRKFKNALLKKLGLI